MAPKTEKCDRAYTDGNAFKNVLDELQGGVSIDPSKDEQFFPSDKPIGDAYTSSEENEVLDAIQTRPDQVSSL